METPKTGTMPNETGKALLKFSTNWNGKLNPQSRYFTTLRLSNRFAPGTEVRIELKGVHVGDGVVVSRKSLYMHELNSWHCGLDTGYEVEDTKEVLRKMYPKANWKRTGIFIHLIKWQPV